MAARRVWYASNRRGVVHWQPDANRPAACGWVVVNATPQAHPGKRVCLKCKRRYDRASAQVMRPGIALRLTEPQLWATAEALRAVLRAPETTRLRILGHTHRVEAARNAFDRLVAAVSITDEG